MISMRFSSFECNIKLCNKKKMSSHKGVLCKIVKCVQIWMGLLKWFVMAF